MIKLFKLIIVVGLITAVTSTGFAFYSNDYAMTTIFSDDDEKITEIINSAFDKYYEESNYYHIKVDALILEERKQAEIKIIKHEDDSYTMSAKIEIEGENPFHVYFVDGVFYRDKDGVEDYREDDIYSNPLTIDSVFQLPEMELELLGGMIFTPNDYGGVTPEDFDMSAEFKFSRSPLYVGQSFLLELEEFAITICVDVLGNLRSLGYDVPDHKITIQQLSVNKQISLNLPESFEGYTPIPIF